MSRYIEWTESGLSDGRERVAIVALGCVWWASLFFWFHFIFIKTWHVLRASQCGHLQVPLQIVVVKSIFWRYCWSCTSWEFTCILVHSDYCGGTVVNLYIRFAAHLCPLIVGHFWGELHLLWNGTPTVPLPHWFCVSCVKRCCSCWCVKNCVSWVSDCCICSFRLSGFGCCCVGSSPCCYLCFLIRLKSRKREITESSLDWADWFVTGTGLCTL